MLSPLIIALDFPSLDEALVCAQKLDPTKVRLKVGKQLFTSEGPRVLDALHGLGFDVFLDLKFHDIPTTVYKASVEAYKLGVWMLNVHALGGSEMMSAALQARNDVNKESKLIAVSILTSHTNANLAHFGIERREDFAKILAHKADDAGLDGIVCAPSDIESIGITKASFMYITPGIRLGPNTDDHNRAFTPKQAFDLGADYIVVGRPISESDEPLLVLDKILSSFN